ncbi:uncharacterized protein LOC135463139 [Liolophura sinensis]|uniref:uncharacterized protein LOC135463139 n=1 Tax=Liolophura sinensis TaxID=3198878 RepID=UPI00315802C9
MRPLVVVLLCLVVTVSSDVVVSDCTATEAEIEAVGQVVFTYGKDLTDEEKTGIAFTVINRVANPHFPNTTLEVVNWQRNTPRKTKRAYAKLTKIWHVNQWTSAKSGNTDEYQTAIRVSRDALCGQASDPTGGATDFASQPTPRVFHAPPNYRAAELGAQLGNIYVFKIQPNVNGGGRGGRRQHGGGRGGHGRRGQGGNRGAPGRRGPGGRRGRPGRRGPGGRRGQRGRQGGEGK